MNVGDMQTTKKLSPHARTGARLFRVERWQRTKALLCCSSRDSREDREFYQAKTVKTHSNNLVVLAHVQLKSFYRLSTRDVTHVRKCTRPSPALPYCKQREVGRGPGNEANDKIQWKDLDAPKGQTEVVFMTLSLLIIQKKNTRKRKTAPMLDYNEI